MKTRPMNQPPLSRGLRMSCGMGSSWCSSSVAGAVGGRGGRRRGVLIHPRRQRGVVGRRLGRPAGTRARSWSAATAPGRAAGRRALPSSAGCSRSGASAGSSGGGVRRAGRPGGRTGRRSAPAGRKCRPARSAAAAGRKWFRTAAGSFAAAGTGAGRRRGHHDGLAVRAADLLAEKLGADRHELVAVAALESHGLHSVRRSELRQLIPESSFPARLVPPTAASPPPPTPARRSEGRPAGAGPRPAAGRRSAAAILPRSFPRPRPSPASSR